MARLLSLPQRAQAAPGSNKTESRTTPHGRLVLTVLAGLAEFERELTRARTGKGRARAKAEGRKMGRLHKLTPHQQREARERRDAGESLSSIAHGCNVHHATIGRL